MSGRRLLVGAALALVSASAIAFGASNAWRKDAVVTFSPGAPGEPARIHIVCPAGWYFIDHALYVDAPSGVPALGSRGLARCPLFGAIEGSSNMYPASGEARIGRGEEVVIHTWPSGPRGAALSYEGTVEIRARLAEDRGPYDALGAP